jgi:hypothetical protein
VIIKNIIQPCSYQLHIIALTKHCGGNNAAIYEIKIQMRKYHVIIFKISIFPICDFLHLRYFRLRCFNLRFYHRDVLVMRCFRPYSFSLLNPDGFFTDTVKFSSRGQQQFLPIGYYLLCLLTPCLQTSVRLFLSLAMQKCYFTITLSGQLISLI